MSEPMRLAYLTSAYARPSDTFVRSEVDRLRRRGLEVETFSIRRPALDSGSDPNVKQHQADTEYLLEAGWLRLLLAFVVAAIRRPKLFVTTTQLAWRTRAPGVRGHCYQGIYLLEAAYLASRIRSKNLVHLHNHIGENSATVAMLAASLAQIPFSLTIHGPAIFFAPERWSLGTKLDRAAFTACISSFCRSQCMRFAKPSTWQRLYVVRCAVGESFLGVPERSARGNGPPLVVCVGRLCTEKGQRLLIDAIAQLVTEGRSVRLLLVGDGPEREALETQIERRKLRDHVEVTGWQSSERVKSLLLEATVMVLPSFAEGLPIVLMEALALECPVISTQIAAIGELVEPNQSGWLLPPGELRPLVDALREAISMPTEQLAALGQHGREKVLAQHHPERQADQLLQLFSKRRCSS